MSETTTTTTEQDTPEEPAAARPTAGAAASGRKGGGGSPLFRNAYALMLNTGVSAVLGLGYWLIAARYYSESAVGQGSAAIAAMKFLAGLTALTLTGALARFIPVSGRRTGRLVFRTYAGSSAVVAFAAAIFLLTLDFWGPSYRFLHGTAHGLGFIAAVIGWSLLTLQDGVLTGLRRALWVPVGNTVFSAAKLALLVGIAAAVPTAGVFVSWVAAIALSVVPLGWLVFRRLVPRHVAATAGTGEPPTAREMGRFVAGDSTGSLFALAVVYLVPVIVASQISSQDNAYFYITMTIGGTVDLLAINMGSSLTVEGSHDPSRIAENCRAALRRMTRIMVPIVVFLLVFAPQILGVFGEGYAEEGAPLLRLLALCSLTRVPVETYFGILRAQSRTAVLAVLQGLLCLLVLGLTLALLTPLGIIGAGWAELASLVVIALAALAGLRRVLASAPSLPVDGEPAAADVAAPEPDVSGAADDLDIPYGTRWAKRAAMDQDTLQLGVHLTFDHPERRPYVTPALGTAKAASPRAHGRGGAPLPLPPAAAGRAAGAGQQSPGTGPDALPGGGGGLARPGRDAGPVARALGIPPKTAALQSPGTASAPSPGTSPDALPGGGGRSPRPSGGSGAAPGGPAGQSPDRTVFGSPERLPILGLPGRRAPGTASGRPEPVVAGAGARGGDAAAPLGTPPKAVRRGRWTAPGPALGVWALLAGALALYWLPLRGMGDADLGSMDGLGLVSVLPKATLLGAMALVAAFAAALSLRAPRPWLLLAVLLATVVSLHSVPALLEAQPRFATAWQHAGFIDYVGRTHEAAPDMDARFSWPGFFAAVTFVAQACGVSDLAEVLRWWPLAMQLLYLAPLMLLLRAVRAGWRAKWCAAWLFVLSGWVGQDYFSPQSVNYLIYLLFVAVLLVWFRSARPPGGRLIPGEAEVRPVGRGDRAVLLALLVGLFAASVVSHQLTPFMMLGVLTVLVLARRSTLRGLPWLCGVLLVGWIGFLAEPYWSGHFNELFGGVGSLGGNVSSSVSGRIQGGSAVHKLVLYTRVALAAAVMSLAALGWWRRRWAGISDRALLVLLLVPFLGFGMQSYGGEMALRVFLFALPGAAVLGSLALFPRSSSDRSWRGPVAALLAGWVLIGGFLVARWGNESFERVRTGEVAAMSYVYEHDSPSARLLWLSTDTVNDVTPSLPWNARDMEKVSYVPALAPSDPVLVGPLVKDLKDAGPHSYLIVNRAQITYLQLDAGYSNSWPAKLLRALDERTDLRRVVSNPDAAVYEMRRQPADWPVKELVTGRVFPVMTWTPGWTAAGVLAGLSLLVLLGARELARVTVPEARRRRGMRVSLALAVPLVVVFLASLVERFTTLN